MSKESKKKAAREGYEALAKDKAERRRRSCSEDRDAAFQETLRKRRVRDDDAVIDAAIRMAHINAPPQSTLRLRELAKVVLDKAPKLIPVHIQALQFMVSAEWLRPPGEWSPKGKGRDALLWSLASHLFAKFPMPNFLWTAFLESPDNARALVPIVTHVAAGGSLYEAIQTDSSLPSLTRKQCHTLLRSPSAGSFLASIRWVQVQSHGGTPRLARCWSKTRPGSRVEDRAREAFWDSVIAFLTKNPMLDTAQVAPLTDYLTYRRNENGSFSMKGRTAMALLQSMAEWHGELNRHRRVGNLTFEPSGFRSGKFDFSHRDKRGNFITQTWRMDEILTEQELAKEGRAQGHCVWSYKDSIEKRHTSIWSLSHETLRRLTIEVRNESRRIVQAAGKHNRAPSNEEWRVMKKWADDNHMQMALLG